MSAGKRSPVLLKALPLGNKLVVSWLALGRPAQPQVLELEEARFVAEDPSSSAPSRITRLHIGPQCKDTPVVFRPSWRLTGWGGSLQLTTSQPQCWAL